MPSVIVWFRRDLRLADNPALTAALESGHSIVPVYIHALNEEKPWQPGAASSAWLHRSLLALDQDLRQRGSRLILRSGDSLKELETLAEQTQAEAVYWNRLYEPACIARDTRVKDALKRRGLQVESFNAALLAEPWTLATGTGGPYRVFTPFWKNLSQRLGSPSPDRPPERLVAPPERLISQALADLNLQPAPPQPAWDEGFWEKWQPGEGGAREALDVFVDGAVHGYGQQRDFPDRIGTSLLSPHLHFGEISPRQILARLRSEHWPARTEPDVAHYLRELGWREFSHHLLYHFPQTSENNLNPRFDDFRWAPVNPETLAAWQQGRTGVPIVDAGMRELWRTGWMHNRVRMIVASFLCKNLRYHWSHGARWFWDTLVDADLANNTQGWQWTAGTGADAAPYFRIFNPVTQAQRFDSAGKYVRRWVPELANLPDKALFAPWELPAATLAELAPDYPSQPLVDLKASREQALAAYSTSR
ncbi:cryptochrome/photolyase family protein [Arenimonas sp.]|uniref:cryptochrome/photolyase family protein n=1 Tax=Arenimonas sp. TaxID=1872635 RepID=UPI0039E28F07